MPKYTFQCQKCNTSKQKYTSAKNREIPCTECGGTMDRQAPSLNGPAEVHETVDKFFNLKQRPDQRELVEKRRDEFYWSVEVPRMVNSGTYSLDTMLEMGWVYFDDKKQMHINTKPPHKR